jgi:proteasome accessory factor A
VSAYKNNTDFHGHSYGCHDNYLLPRGVPFERIASGLIPFLISRQVVAGAGKMGAESPAGLTAGRYQLSQRADFIETELSVNTMHNRPVVNTRDEPHADPARFRRLHLILGDANMAEYATALKVGTTRLVLELIARAATPEVTAEQPVAAVKALSQDSDLKTTVRLADGRRLTAIELQRLYLDAAHRHLEGADPETDWVLREWAATLDALARDRASLIGRVDWVTKQWLLETFAQDARVAWDDPWLVSLDLAYHHLDPGRGLFRALQADGTAGPVATPDAVTRAVRNPPEDTRAAIRGLCVSRYGGEIESIQWAKIVTRSGAVLDLGSVVEPEETRKLLSVLRETGTLSEGIGAWREQTRHRGGT